ncbi:MAG: threonine--tRNA ligase [bacterium]|nr:threonine--tRNA ligase [bacterium]
MSAQEIDLTLPDGTVVTVPNGTSSLEVAQKIGPGLGKAALASQLEGEYCDLRAPLRRGGAFRVITARDPDGGEVIRHSAEHVMADAVKRLWPETQIDVGRSDHSEKFQYDFDIPTRIGPDDLPRIEAEMNRIIEEDLPFERDEIEREQAKQLFESMGEHLKVSRIDDIPDDQTITVFRNGSFADLCRGPHVQRTGQIGAFKLTELAGAYWRGDESKQMLQRVYGIAFKDKKELKAHERLQEEARKRDHRRLGQELDLFLIHEWAPGSPFFLPKGLRLYNNLVEYVRGLYRKYGFDEVMAPQLFSAELFKVSGHYENFGEDMFLMPGADEGEEVGLKPMNCPGHCLIFRARPRSYRELPLRLAEFSRLHRNERSGTLHGLTRVRTFAQDDGHIYCAPDQLRDEIDRHMEMTAEIYRDLGLSGVEIAVATRPEKFIGDPDEWESVQKMLVDAVERAGYECGINPGEGAFYAPKIEFNFRDALKRSWQLATVQIDMAMPSRFELKYVGADGKEHEPKMVHRAILGSLERFIAVYLEHTGGDLPLWLAPVQVTVLPVSDKHTDYAQKVTRTLQDAGVQAQLDARNETLNYRVRGSETQKIPYILVVGDRESDDGSVTVRRRHKKGQESFPVDEFRSKIEEEIRTRGIS